MRSFRHRIMSLISVHKAQNHSSSFSDTDINLDDLIETFFFCVFTFVEIVCFFSLPTFPDIFYLSEVYLVPNLLVFA